MEESIVRKQNSALGALFNFIYMEIHTCVLSHILQGIVVKITCIYCVQFVVQDKKKLNKSYVEQVLRTKSYECSREVNTGRLLDQQ